MRIKAPEEMLSAICVKERLVGKLNNSLGYPFNYQDGLKRAITEINDAVINYKQVKSNK